eukprot:5098917-Pyramimonas_sp.AAC.2
MTQFQAIDTTPCRHSLLCTSWVPCLTAARACFWVVLGTRSLQIDRALTTYDIPGSRPRSRPGLGMGNLVAPNGMYTLRRCDNAGRMMGTSRVDTLMWLDGSHPLD